MHQDPKAPPRQPVPWNKGMRVSGTRRSPALPDVPTIAEAGLPGYEVVLWNGLLAPKGTPKDVIARIAADTSRALKLPDGQTQGQSKHEQPS